jgi:hypothetical protein
LKTEHRERAGKFSEGVRGTKLRRIAPLFSVALDEGGEAEKLFRGRESTT